MNKHKSIYPPGMSEAENDRWWHKQREMCKAADWLQDFNLSLTESRYELESDEGGTAREKAIGIQRKARQ